MDIGSGKGYPGSALSNFAPHPFIFDGLRCNSAEGAIQGFKFKNPEKQKMVCQLVGKKAKFAGKKKKWWRTQTLWWKGKEVDRHGPEYQKLLDKLYAALSRNSSFKKALLATGDAVLRHSIGKSNPHKTVLTTSEFCGRLMKLRKILREKDE